MRLILLSALLCSLNAFAAPGDLVKFQEVRNKATASIADMRTRFCPAEINNSKAIESTRYSITFKTKDLKGNEVESAGFFVVPLNPEAHGLVVYQHGTVFARKELPSSYPEYAEGDGLRYCFASLGYVAMTADYLGFGDGTGIHPYLHAESEAWVARDMMRAVNSALKQLNVTMNGKLFLAGYSQGGQAALALLRFLEQDPAHEFTVTAAAPMAGPYSLVEITPALMHSPSEHTASEASYIILGLGQVYPIYKNLSEVFLPPYDKYVESLFDGSHGWEDVLRVLTAPMDKVFHPDFTNEITNNPNAPFMQAQRANRVDMWAPKTPVTLYHGAADVEVPFAISQIAYKNMKSLGGNVSLVDLGATIDHSKGYPLAIGQAALWFETF